MTVLDASQIAPGNIIQITDEAHSWYPALLIVDEVKSWGVQAYVIIPKTNDGSEAPALAYNRLEYGCFDMVGVAQVAVVYERDEKD